MKKNYDEKEGEENKIIGVEVNKIKCSMGSFRLKYLEFMVNIAENEKCS